MVIYVITNAANGKQYVGKTKTAIKRRLQQHRRLSRDVKSRTLLSCAIRKYGESSFSIEHVDIAFSKYDLNRKEIAWIAKYQSFGKGYNMTRGGEEAPEYIVSEESKQKRRELGKKRYEDPLLRQKAAEWAKLTKLTDEGRERLRIRFTGNTHAKGNTFKHTDEAKKKISEGNARKRLSEHTKQLIGNAHRGKVVSDETRLKQSQSHLGTRCGIDNPMADPAVRAKVGASKVGRKKMLRPDGSWYFGYPDTTTKA
jgi:group I intron endonuclease